MSKKKSNSREYSSSSSDSDSEEVVWSESKSKNESNEWFDLFEKNCSKNEKTNKKSEEKKEKHLNDLKIRQQRELNPYLRYDSEGNHIIDEPRQQHRSSGGQSQRSDRRQLPEKDSQSSKAFLSEKNAINAKLLKAELMGNQTLIKELKDRLKQLESNESADISTSAKDRNEDRDQYFSVEKTSNEESMSLKELYYREKKLTAEDENRIFVATTSKTVRKPDDEYEETHKKHKKRRHNETKSRFVRQEDEDRDKCKQCLENIDKQLILSVGEKTIVSLTPFEPFVKGMCHILSRTHSNVTTISCDEQCLQEINERKHQISKFFAKQNKCVIFMETYFKKRLSNRHLVIECIPIKSKYEIDSKIFFKKAIMECEGEWAMNKQVIEIKDRPVTKLIPKGLSYFWVTIGPKNDGFGHVIENEESFSPNFGKEIIGGILDIEPNKWIKPKYQNYDKQFERVIKLKKDWNKEFQQ